jgi:hypothetical protein
VVYARAWDVRGIGFAALCRQEGIAMRCEVCGNDYDKAFVVECNGQRHTFDSFECAIHALAPTCAQCGCHIVGHGVEVDEVIYCCAHCAHASGSNGVADRATTGRRSTSDALVREASEESFPASDAPAWAGGR